MEKLGTAIRRLLEDVAKSYGMPPVCIVIGLAPIVISAAIRARKRRRAVQPEVPVDEFDFSVPQTVVLREDCGLPMMEGGSFVTGVDDADTGDENYPGTEEEEEDDDDDYREEESGEESDGCSDNEDEDE